MYTKTSMISIRYGLQRHFQNTHDIDIVKDNSFAAANEIFKAILIKLKAIGKGIVTHKTAIPNEEMDKLYTSPVLSTSSPVTLQNKVFIDVMLHFCSRGRENLRDMMKTDFVISTDEYGDRFVKMQEKISKNHRETLQEDETSRGGRMYATNTSLCPVASMEKYLSSLNPDCPNFWQRAKAIVKEDDKTDIWFDNAPLGKNKLGDKMKSLSVEAGLSKIYTNHCLRATSVTTLDRQGFEARHIIGISGHKSETSLKHYCRVESEKKREMSHAITTFTSTEIESQYPDDGPFNYSTTPATSPNIIQPLELSSENITNTVNTKDSVMFSERQPTSFNLKFTKKTILLIFVRTRRKNIK
ncbi:uncharacterized protein LOC111085608 [Limulus polyphemus]|uniref:Uncharacterized protein LOC111085608 n=1 Tax=Limulus polyphemus TaxID=6850 RepID=A0ABM1SAR2_LIMPO|nr:uncharacterized protein LOC111085608 [Limulus polyphemus]